MTDEQISEAIDNIARELHGQGMTPMEVKVFLKEEADRVANELDNEMNDFTR